jgi:dual-specificity kinase
LLEQIGQGTFGKVAKAYDTITKTHVAVKIIRAVPKYQEAAKAELRVLQDLARHDPPNTRRCIHMKEKFEHVNHTCMVFDLLEISVFDFLKDNHYNPFPISHIQSFAHQLIHAVDFLHSDLKLIHTDLKPENLMLVRGDNDVRFDSKVCPTSK